MSENETEVPFVDVIVSLNKGGEPAILSLKMEGETKTPENIKPPATAKKFSCKRFLGAAALAVVLFLFVTLFLSTLVLGIVYYNSCPGGSLPLMDIIGGSYLILVSIIIFSVTIESEIKRGKPQKHQTGFQLNFTCCQILLLCNYVVVFFFIVGFGITLSVFVFKLLPNVTFKNEKDAYYCHPALFWFTLVLAVIFLSIIVVGLCGMLLGIMVENKRARETKRQSLLDSFRVV